MHDTVADTDFKWWVKVAVGTKTDEWLIAYWDKARMALPSTALEAQKLCITSRTDAPSLTVIELGTRSGSQSSRRQRRPSSRIITSHCPPGNTVKKFTVSSSVILVTRPGGES